MTRQTWRSLCAPAAVSAGAIIPGDDVGQRWQNEVYQKNPNAVATDFLGIELPPNLKSYPKGVCIDLADPAQVAAAMGVQLSGDPNQVLYSYIIRGNNAVKTVEVTVATLAETAKYINFFEDKMVSHVIGNPKEGVRLQSANSGRLLGV